MYLEVITDNLDLSQHIVSLFYSFFQALMLDLLPELAAMDLAIKTCMELIIPQSKLSLTGNFLNSYQNVY